MKRSLKREGYIIALSAFVLGLSGFFNSMNSQTISAVPSLSEQVPASGIHTDHATAMVIDFVCRLRYEDLPEPVVRKAKVLIANTLSCMALGASEPEGKALLQYVKKLQGGTGSCAIFGADFSTSSAIAAFANAAQAQIHDANDGFIWAEAKNTCCHPGRLIVPAAIAWAESYGASGKELIAAVVAGYEFTGRAQKMTQLTRDTYVAALVAGKLAGLNADKLSQALIMAAYNSPGRTGIPSPWIDEYWLSNGQAVRVGLEAVMMIQAGFHTSDIRNSKTMPWNMDGNSLGDRWMTLDTYIKLYPCCLNIQESIDLALSLTKQNKLHGSDISRIDISRWWGLYVGSERLEPGAGRMRAQLNIFYCVASAVSNGKFDQNNFTPASIADEKVRSLANKVFLHQLPKEQIKPDMPFGFTRMTITTNDGKQVEGIEEYSPGHSQLSIPPDKLRTMCLERFGLVLPEAQSKILYDAIQRLEEYDNVAGFTKLFRL